ncbi:Uncharacterized protein Fot_55808 [Forsythia ovata]|uniref:Uncharacterized protein n=1 Tax=Forsythia ovata TaxID=205694 RepID=A0ABD1P383_9LAMI
MALTSHQILDNPWNKLGIHPQLDPEMRLCKFILVLSQFNIASLQISGRSRYSIIDATQLSEKSPRPGFDCGPPTKQHYVYGDIDEALDMSQLSYEKALMRSKSSSESDNESTKYDA